MPSHNTAVPRYELVDKIADRLSIKVSKAVINEVLREFGPVAADVLASGKSVQIEEVGVLKQGTQKGRRYPNPRGGDPIMTEDRTNIRLSMGLGLKRRLGRVVAV